MKTIKPCEDCMFYLETRSAYSPIRECSDNITEGVKTSGFYSIWHSAVEATA